MKTHLVYNIERDYANLVKENLLQYGYGPLPDDLMELLIIYYNYHQRIIERIPRTINKSNSFICSEVHREVVERIENLIQIGGDITPYLSTNIKNPNYQDTMLYDWDIHHLHLGKTIRSDGFIERTGDLLFARFFKSTAYFIIIGKHGDWTEKKLLEIIHENWPESIAHFKQENVVKLENEYNSNDIRKLRKANINITHQIGDSFYIPIGWGYTASGHSSMSIFNSLRTFKKLRIIKNKLIQDSDKIIQLYINRYKYKVNIIELSFYVDSERNAYVYSLKYDFKYTLGRL